MDKFNTISQAMKKEPRSPSTENAADAMLRLSSGGGGGALQLSTATSSSTTSCSSNMGVRAMLPSSPGSSSNPGSSLSMPLGPMTLKDEQYWVKRRKNNVAARRSREKRRINDAEMNIRIRQLIQQNQKLEDELTAIKLHFGLPVDNEFVATSTQAASGVKKRATAAQVHRGVAVEAPQTSWTHVKSENRSEPLVHGEPATYMPANSGVTFITRPSVFPGLPHVTGIPSALAYGGGAGGGESPPPAPASLLPTSPPPAPPSPIHQNPLHIDETSQGGDQEDDQVKEEQRTYDDDDNDDEMDDASTGRPTSANYALQAMLKVKAEVIDQAEPSDCKPVEGEPETALSGFPAKMRYRNWRAGEIDCASSSTSAAKMESTDSQASGSPPDVCSDNAATSFSGDFDASLPADDALRYIERRRRNNMAARKCRENRKKQNTMRVAKSTILETENNKLKMELRSLNDEYTSLYRLMENKKRNQMGPSSTGLVGQALVGQSTVGDKDDAGLADSEEVKSR